MENFKPSLERVMKDLQGLDYELQMFCYHKLNGRDTEAQSYLDTYNFQREQTLQELTQTQTELPTQMINELPLEDNTEQNEVITEPIKNIIESGEEPDVLPNLFQQTMTETGWKIKGKGKTRKLVRKDDDGNIIPGTEIEAGNWEKKGAKYISTNGDVYYSNKGEIEWVI